MIYLVERLNERDSLLLQTKSGLDTLREMEKMLTSLLLVLLIVHRLTSLCEGDISWYLMTSSPVNLYRHGENENISRSWYRGCWSRVERKGDIQIINLHRNCWNREDELEYQARDTSRSCSSGQVIFSIVMKTVLVSVWTGLVLK